MSPALFSLVILEIGSHFLPRPTWTKIVAALLFLSFTPPRMTGEGHHIQLLSLRLYTVIAIFFLVNDNKVC
jgi:hypothetical protein